MKSNYLKDRENSVKRATGPDLLAQDICGEHKIVFNDKIFSSAFHYAAIGMALVAPDGRWLAVNRSLCKLVGYTEYELLSRTYQDITHSDDINENLSYVNKMLLGEIDTYQMEKRYFHKNGEIVNVMLSVSLVRDDNWRPLFFISQIQDITVRKQLESELVKLATEDSLTGASTRRRFFEFATREITRQVGSITPHDAGYKAPDILISYPPHYRSFFAITRSITFFSVSISTGLAI